MTDECNCDDPYCDCPDDCECEIIFEPSPELDEAIQDGLGDLDDE